MTRPVAALAALLALSIPVLGGCGDDSDADDASATTESTESTESPESVVRYCELVAGLEASGEEIFGALGEDATDAELVAAEAQLVDENAAQLDEMVDVAPEEIADDVAAYVEGYRARAAGDEGPDVAAEEERILAYEETHC